MPVAKKSASPPPQTPAVEVPAVVEEQTEKTVEPVARAGGWVDRGDGHGWVPEED